MSTDTPSTALPDQGTDGAPFRPLVVLGDGVAAPELSALEVVRLGSWMQSLVAEVTPGTPPRAVHQGSPVLGLILTEADRSELEANDPVRDLVAALDTPVSILAADAPPAAVADAALGFLAALTDRYRRNAAEERAATAALRGQHRDMQTRFAEVEEFFYHSLSPRYIRTEEFAPADASIDLSGGDPPLLQRLPFSTRSMAAVDLFLREAPEGPGILSLTLCRSVGPDIAAPIDLDIEGMTPGWIRFILPTVLVGEPQDVLARVAFRSEGTVKLALGHPSPVAEYRVVTGSGPSGAPLALRGYRGLPGAPLPPAHMPRHTPPADGSSRMVSAGDLRPVRKLPILHKWETLGGYADFTSVEYWTGENAILVHPSTNGPVVAIIRNVAASALRQLRASIHVGHRKSGPISFAMGAAPAGRVHRLNQATRWLGAWTSLVAGEFGTAFAAPERPIIGPFDLLLATTMEGRHSNSNAWALFRDIEMVNGPLEA